MKLNVLITGANGGIGRGLVHRLKEVHSITALIKQNHVVDPINRNIKTVRGDVRDGALIESLTKNTDVIIHAAASFKRDLYDVTTSGTENVIKNFKNKNGLFVFLSSMVVYSNQTMSDEKGYHEEQELIIDNSIDTYTKSKLNAEKIVIQTCKKMGIDYIILRPTIVYGEHLTWTTIGFRAARWFPYKISKCLADFIHVDDFSEIVFRLITNNEARNQIFNVGGVSETFDNYINAAANSSHKKITRSFPILSKMLVKISSSSFWFLKKDLLINSEKVRDFTNYRKFKSPQEFYQGISVQNFRPKTTQEFIEAYNTSKHSFKPIGHRYSFTLRKQQIFEKALIHTTQFNKIISVNDNKVTVQCGITLKDLTEQLDHKYNLTLSTLPEFLEVTVGSCLTTPVHGSSIQYANFAALASSIVYLKEGQTHRINQESSEWNQIIYSNDKSLIFIEATLNCVPSYKMTRSISWHPEDQIIHGIVNLFRENDSCTIMWYPRKKLTMVWKMNRTTSKKRRKVPNFIRHMTPAAVRFLPMKKRVFIDKSHHILGSWKELSKLFLFGMKLTSVYDYEVAIPVDKFDIFLDKLNKKRLEHSKLKSVAFRCSAQDKVVNSPSYGKEVIWVEVATGDKPTVQMLSQLRHEVGGRVHWGKSIV